MSRELEQELEEVAVGTAEATLILASADPMSLKAAPVAQSPADETPGPSPTPKLTSASNSDAVNRIHQSFRRKFSSFSDEPWILSSGTVVDDVLWEYALSLQTETAIHSFVIDCGNSRVKNLFKENDWNEIISSSCKFRPTIPDWVLRQLFAYSQQNTTKKMHDFLRTGWATLLPPPDDNVEEDDEEEVDEEDDGEEANERHATAYTDKEESMDIFDKERLTATLYRAVLNIFAEYTSISQDIRGNENSEGWFAVHVSGALIDGLLSDLPSVQLLRGEKMSVSSSIRKNQTRDITSAKAFGRKVDGIFASRHSSKEYGAIEVGKKDEGAAGSKVLTDGLKIAKIMKDMFDQTFTVSKDQTFVKQNLEIVGILQSALRVQFLSLDFVAGRFSRLNREKTFEVPKSLDHVKSLMLLIKEILVLGRRVERAEETAKQAIVIDDELFLHDLFDHLSTPPRNPVPNPATLQTPDNSPQFQKGGNLRKIVLRRSW
ncbi:hypothetical protein BGZ58_002310 [Dissophora ornata]|nr:hypothetical protein BGZ58_002310 [Dissophora ornata]